MSPSAGVRSWPDRHHIHPRCRKPAFLMRQTLTLPRRLASSPPTSRTLPSFRNRNSLPLRQVFGAEEAIFPPRSWKILTIIPTGWPAPVSSDFADFECSPPG
jgi:hypothetical protein